VESTPLPATTTATIPIIDQNTEQQFNTIGIRHLIWKLDRRLIPFLVLLEMSSYINRTNTGMCLFGNSIIDDRAHLGHAKLMGFDTDLRMSQSESNWAVSLFFLAYVRELRK
jgi:hypothetical protein